MPLKVATTRFHVSISVTFQLFLLRSNWNVAANSSFVNVLPRKGKGNRAHSRWERGKGPSPTLPSRNRARWSSHFAFPVLASAMQAIEAFFRQNINSNFRYGETIIHLVLGGVNIPLKRQSQLYFRQANSRSEIWGMRFLLSFNFFAPVPYRFSAKNSSR